MRPREYAVLWRNLHRWEKFYTATGSAGSNKSMQRYHWSQQILKSCRWARNYIFCNKNAVIDRCCNKNVVIARFRNKNALIGRFREFFLFVWQKSHDMSW